MQAPLSKPHCTNLTAVNATFRQNVTSEVQLSEACCAKHLDVSPENLDPRFGKCASGLMERLYCDYFSLVSGQENTNYFQTSDSR